MADKDPKNQPDRLSTAQARALKAVKVCRDVYAGTLRLRELGAEYLPMFPLEDEEDWAVRLRQSVLFNAFRRSVHGLTGLVMRSDIEPNEKVPPKIVDQFEDVDLEGNHLDVFAFDLLRDALIDGQVGVLVDMDAVEEGAVKNLADEQARGLRPYWVKVTRSQLLRWTTTKVAGRKFLASLAYKECIPVPDGDFGDREVDQVRTFQLVVNDDVRQVHWETWRKGKNDKGEEEWTSAGKGVMRGIDEIPFVTIYAGKTGFMLSDPPLEDLAHENLLHFTTRSDRQNSLHICGVPIPWTKGLPKNEMLKVGPGHAANLPLTGDLQYLEPKGSALQASGAELDKIEQRMATLGLAMLAKVPRMNETAEAKRLDRSEQDSALAKAARSLEDGLENCVRLQAKWQKIELDGEGAIVVNDNFADLTLDPQALAAIAALVPTKLSVETMWQMMQAGGLLPDDFDPEVEKDRIDQTATKQAAAMAPLLKAAQRPPAPPAPPAKIGATG